MHIIPEATLISDFTAGLCLFDKMDGTRTLILLLLAVTVINAANQITSLPGLSEIPNFSQYAGYITVNETLGKNYYYWFVESQNDPANDPILLWMQGGPGCSGLLGFWTENGPFVLSSVR